jgi:hypothetical protein
VRLHGRPRNCQAEPRASERGSTVGPGEGIEDTIAVREGDSLPVVLDLDFHPAERALGPNDDLPALSSMANRVLDDVQQRAAKLGRARA